MIDLNQGGTKYIEMCLKKMMMLLMYSYVSLPDRAFYVRWKVEISSSHLSKGERNVVIMTKEDVINHGEDNRGKQDWLTSLTTSSRPGS